MFFIGNVLLLLITCCKFLIFITVLEKLIISRLLLILYLGSVESFTLSNVISIMKNIKTGVTKMG